MNNGQMVAVTTQGFSRAPVPSRVFHLAIYLLVPPPLGSQMRSGILSDATGQRQHHKEEDGTRLSGWWRILTSQPCICLSPRICAFRKGGCPLGRGSPPTMSCLSEFRFLSTLYPHGGRAVPARSSGVKDTTGQFGPSLSLCQSLSRFLWLVSSSCSPAGSRQHRAGSA